MKTESTQCDSNTVSPDGQVPRPAERLSQPTTECGAYALSGRVQALCMVLIAVILVSNLGLDPLRGSEGRWAVIARSMFRTGDLFNPLLGLKPYWDKPLLSYWQILPGAWLFGGVTEFSLRLPSVLWGIVMLVLTYDLARRLIGKETAVVSVGVLATSYGFVLWARHGQVEMTNAATILLCLWYFVRHKGDNGAGWIYGLGAIAGLCANMKGLTAYAVPGFCIAVWAIVRRDISWLPPLRHLVAASVVSILAYLSIPIMSSLACSSVDPFRLARLSHLTSCESAHIRNSVS